MKNYTLLITILLLPFTLMAQSGPLLYKDFYSGIKSVKSLVFNEHLNILQVNVDNENFDIVAVNDRMQILWRASFSGFVFTTAKFKNKIIAVASSGHSTFKGSTNNYKAYLINPESGTLIVEKEIYNGTDEYMEFPSVFTGKGDYFKFCIRKSLLERRLHVGLPGMFGLISVNKMGRELNATKELDEITFNEKLEIVSNITLPVSPGTMVNWCANNQADLFIAWLNGPSVEVYKYTDGSAVAVKRLKANIAFNPDDNVIPSEHLQFLASSTSNDILYYGVTYLNQDNDAELGIGKFDFSTGKQLYVAEAFNKEHVKTLQKSFTPVNKKINDAELGRRISLHLRYLGEAEGNLVAALTSRYTRPGMEGVWMVENSVLINGYDDNLNTRFQQILPSNYSVPNVLLPFGYYITKNKFYIVGNNKSGLTTLNGVYGCLDINAGKWEKMNELSKKKIGNSDYSNGDAILWFADSYVVPYFSARGLMQNKFDVTLQQNEY